MVTLKGSVLVVFSTLSLALVSPAQGEFSVEGEFDGKVTISYSNEDLAGEVIVIEVDDGGMHDPETEYIYVHLDEEGQAEINWTLPDWDFAIFHARDSAPVMLIIEGSEGGLN